MASWRKIPIVNHIHGADFDEFYVNAPEEKKIKIKKVYSKCNVLIALSEEWKERRPFERRKGKNQRYVLDQDGKDL